MENLADLLNLDGLLTSLRVLINQEGFEMSAEKLRSELDAENKDGSFERLLSRLTDIGLLQTEGDDRLHLTDKGIYVFSRLSEVEYLIGHT